MNANQLINAIGHIDDRYVLAYAAQTAAPVKTSAKPFVRWVAAVCAATMALAATLLILPTIEQHHNNIIVSDGVPVASTTTPTTDRQDGLQNNTTTPTVGLQTTNPNESDSLQTPSTSGADSVTDEPTEPSGDRIVLNSVGDFLSGGARLVNPIEVSEAEFCAEYPVNLTAYLGDTAYDVTYRFQYHLLDLSTGTTDFSRLSNGWISISDNGQVLFSVYVATDKYVSDLGYTQPTETNNSVVSGCDVLLFEGLLHGRTPCLYGKFRLNGLYVTFDTTRCTQEEMVALIQSLIQNTH